MSGPGWGGEQLSHGTASYYTITNVPIMSSKCVSGITFILEKVEMLGGHSFHVVGLAPLCLKDFHKCNDKKETIDLQKIKRMHCISVAS